MQSKEEIIEEDLSALLTKAKEARDRFLDNRRPNPALAYRREGGSYGFTPYTRYFDPKVYRASIETAQRDFGFEKLRKAIFGYNPRDREAEVDYDQAVRDAIENEDRYRAIKSTLSLVEQDAFKPNLDSAKNVAIAHVIYGSLLFGHPTIGGDVDDHRIKTLISNSDLFPKTTRTPIRVDNLDGSSSMMFPGARLKSFHLRANSDGGAPDMVAVYSPDQDHYPETPYVDGNGEREIIIPHSEISRRLTNFNFGQ